MKEKRPLTQVNASVPGSDVAAETAAAMASASLVFKKSDPTYSSTLLKHARQLFDFADKYKGSYSENIPEVATYYNSTGYRDELLWAAGWLYHATGEQSYLDYATGENGRKFASWGSPTWFSWDNKNAGTQVLLSRLSLLGDKDANANSGLGSYRKSAVDEVRLTLTYSFSQTRTLSGMTLLDIKEGVMIIHQQYVSVVTQLGIDKVVPKRTLDLMDVPRLTRENVASHLQIARMLKNPKTALEMALKLYLCFFDLLQLRHNTCYWLLI